MSRTKQPSNISDIIKKTSKMGDQLYDVWEDTLDLKAAITGLKAYNTAINAVKAQLIYKKQSGHPSRIEFLEK